jgi:predicted RNA-binding protein (virulence factor B family)
MTEEKKIEIGKQHRLKVNRLVEFGAYLDGGNQGEILLPSRYMPSGLKSGDNLLVFLYLDSEDRLIATTEEPLGMAGEFCFLKVVATTQIGAFMDWGLPKDLLVPFREQKQRMKKGSSYLVYIYIDDQSGRIAASSKLEKFLNQHPTGLTVGENIEALVVQKTDLGYKVIINQTYPGMIHQQDVYQSLKTGQKLSAYIKKIRADGKIDVTSRQPGFNGVMNLMDRILAVLNEKGGSLPINDTSPPARIYELFGVSKKTYKKAIGVLYKKKLIDIDKNGIRLK